ALIIGPPTVAENVEVRAAALPETLARFSVIVSTRPSCWLVVTTVVVTSPSSGMVSSGIPATSLVVSLNTSASRTSTKQRKITPTPKKIANTSPTTAPADTLGSVPSRCMPVGPDLIASRRARCALGHGARQVQPDDVTHGAFECGRVRVGDRRETEQ